MDQADLEAVEVSTLELLLDLVEGVLDLVLEATFIIMTLVLDPVAMAVAVAVGLMRMRHGQGGGGADQLRKGLGGEEGKRKAEVQGRRGASRSVDRVPG